MNPGNTGLPPVRVHFHGTYSIPGCEVYIDDAKVGRILYNPDSALRWRLEFNNVRWKDGLPIEKDQEGASFCYFITERAAKTACAAATRIWLTQKYRDKDDDGDVCA